MNYHGNDNIDPYLKMITLKKLQFTLLFVLGLYLAISLFVGFAHNHDMDGTYHDDCPACLWEIQFRNTDTTTPVMWVLVCDSVRAGPFQVPSSTFVSITHIFYSVPESRAPPSFHSA
ncbi:hypothetical protein JW835_08300 [bacterium]|nr:hypothetical protein [bacterium]